MCCAVLCCVAAFTSIIRSRPTLRSNVVDQFIDRKSIELDGHELKLMNYYIEQHFCSVMVSVIGDRIFLLNIFIGDR